MNLPHTFDFHQQISEVVLVGTGGTGSQVARTLCRIVYDLRRRGQHTPALKFVDPDVVEAKNVGRQMFLDHEIGKPKAAVLATRFNFAMGLNIAAYVEPFDANRHTANYGSLLVGCVDNHQARIALSKARGLWLDCGNDRASGQVCIGNVSDRGVVQRCIKDNTYHSLPNAALLFPQLLEPEPEGQVIAAPAAGCAEQVESGEQGLLTNDMIGIVAGEYLFKALNRQPITTFLTYVAVDALSMRSLTITAEHLSPFLA